MAIVESLKAVRSLGYSGKALVKMKIVIALLPFRKQTGTSANHNTLIKPNYKVAITEQLTDIHAGYDGKRKNRDSIVIIYTTISWRPILRRSWGLHTPKRRISRDTVVIYGPFRRAGRIRTYHRAFAADNDEDP